MRIIPWGRDVSAAPTQWRDEDRSMVFGLRRDIERLFDDVVRGSLGALWGERGLAWPTMEVSETEQEVQITAEVPGMSDKDLELVIDDGVLTIRGERKARTGYGERGYSERFYGRFQRRIALPSGLDEESAQGDFRDGVLTVTLPRLPQAERGRRIPIGGGAQTH